MSISHIFEYSKSSKAKCHGPPPCQGSFIGLGELRYGQVSFNEKFGEVVQWRHWGCVTPAILQQLAVLNFDRIPGFKRLRPMDQAKIRQAVARKRVDPADIPETARNANIPPPPSAATSNMNQHHKKRKSEAVAGSSSSPTNVPPSSQTVHGFTLTQMQTQPEVIEIDDDVEDTPEVVDELYCILRSKVVGLQYYAGLVGDGEEVNLVREPQNKYDRNAIRVVNIAGQQVGHIPRTDAAQLAPLLDQQLISVEGIILEGNLTGRPYSIPISVKIFGACSQREMLEGRLTWATPGQRGFPPPNRDGSRVVPGADREPRRTYNTSGPVPSQAIAGLSYQQSSQYPTSSQHQASHGLTPSQMAMAKNLNLEQQRKQQAALLAQQDALRKAAELRSMLNTLEKVDDESRRTSLLDTLCSTEDVLNLPEHPSPPGVASGELTVNLLRHQSQGLQWCIDREYPKLPQKESDKPEQFWLYKKTGNKSYYYNLATRTPQENVPVLGRGALCADSMGLGKTLTMIALILATKTDIPADYSRTTLIVVPLSLISNWEGQIKQHCKRGALSLHVYYGPGRNVTPKEMKKFDVVLTTYQVVTKEHGDSGALPRDEFAMTQGPSKRQKKGLKGLFGVHWKRIILDEGHNIRNPRTKMAKAVCALSAQRRWIVTGTPIINSPRDLGSILTFLQICRPLDNEDYYKRLLLRPLKDGDQSGYELLRAVMSQICIRRTKEMQNKDGKYLVALPGVEMVTIPVKLDTKARELYDAIEEASQNKFRQIMDSHGGFTIPTNVLSMLTRLRQIALHPGLVPSNYLEQLKCSEDEPDGPVAQLTAQDRIRLQAALAQAIEDSEECPICFDILNNPRITPCAHSFCLPCITETLSRDPKCPMDRRQITPAELVEPAPQTDLTQAPVPRVDDDDDDDELRQGSSAKIDQLVHLLQLTPANEKSLVFSQFTSFLDKITETLDKVGIPYVRFDGKMSARRRQETLERFCIPIEDDIASTPCAPTPTVEPKPSSLPRRRSRSSKIILAGESDDNADDGDFVATQDDDDDSFIDDEDDDFARPKKGKGKGKGKKGRGNTRATVGDSGFTDSFSFSERKEIPKVMLISLKAGALGLNLTVANNVYLMDPWWQEGIESQAIDRCNRIGQKRKVHVYQLIAEDTVEAKVLDIQEKKKKLINQAFSGMKGSAETQRQKKEARLQDLIELFGVRQQQATQTQSTLDHMIQS